MIDINKIKEEFREKFGEPEANNDIVAGSETTNEISDWWLSKLSQALETRNKELVEATREDLKELESKIRWEWGDEEPPNSPLENLKNIITLIQSK